MMVWAFFAILGTQYHHCGFRWPWTPTWDEQPNFHDFHHERFNANFGVMGWLDMLHGTDREYRQFVAKRAEANTKDALVSAGSTGAAVLALVTAMAIGSAYVLR